MVVMERILARRSLLVALAVIGAILGAVIYGDRYGDTRAYAVNADTASQANVRALLDVQSAFTAIAERLGPTVVNITAERQVEALRPSFEDFFRDFPGFPRVPAPRPRESEPDTRTLPATGSGVIVRSDGYIMTNDHVVGGADRVVVTLKDGREFSGSVLRDPYSDLALVKIDVTGLPVAEFADSDQVKVGQWAIAMGNPFGLEHTMTVGVVSAVTRSFSVPDPSNPGEGRYYPDAIQTDASINRGNSGGPLFDIDGKIIGINAAIFSPSGGNIGVGFAIPSNTATFVMEELITEGRVTRGYLGLMPTDLTPKQAEIFGVNEGAVVQSVDEDTPAAEAGFKPMDVITEFGGQKVKDALDLRRKAARAAPGRDVKVKVQRDGKPVELTVKMGERPDSLAKVEAEEKTDADKVGLRVETLTADMAEQMRLRADTRGVVVRSVRSGSPAARAGIRMNDVIIRVGFTDIKDVRAFREAIGNMNPGDTAIFLVMTAGRTRLAEVTLD